MTAAELNELLNKPVQKVVEGSEITIYSIDILKGLHGTYYRYHDKETAYLNGSGLLFSKIKQALELARKPVRFKFTKTSANGKNYWNIEVVAVLDQEAEIDGFVTDMTQDILEAVAEEVDDDDLPF